MLIFYITDEKLKYCQLPIIQLQITSLWVESFFVALYPHIFKEVDTCDIGFVFSPSQTGSECKGWGRGGKRTDGQMVIVKMGKQKPQECNQFSKLRSCYSNNLCMSLMLHVFDHLCITTSLTQELNVI
jgi:hypothetical protein